MIPVWNLMFSLWSLVVKWIIHMYDHKYFLLDGIIAEAPIGCCNTYGHVMSRNDFNWLNSF